jgi:hypothetical protein
VSYHRQDGLKKSTQKAYHGNKLNTYYVDEHTYDRKGNIIKTKQVEYFGSDDQEDRKFIVWETKWKVYSGQLVPVEAKCNGVTFCDIKWKVLSTHNKGKVEQDIKVKFYHKSTVNLLIGTSHEFWNADLREYPVPFRLDKKFVVSHGNHNVLTLGYDNVVLSSYNFSYGNLVDGMSKTNQRSNIFQSSVNSVVDFKLNWNVIGGKPCLRKLDYKAKFPANEAHLEVEMDYTSGGKRKSETWNMFDNTSFDGKIKKITVFKQEVKY